jgi:lipoprotein-anchoring transpeptidase ErfK/SrfK
MTAMEAGSLPQRGDHLAGIGGAIGIHGSDKEALNERGEDWTLGCISLTNDDVRELDALVPLGTPVLIQE